MYNEDQPCIDFENKRKIKSARKEHLCNICRKNIKIGESYSRVVVVEEGKLYSWKEHEFHCWDDGASEDYGIHTGSY